MNNHRNKLVSASLLALAVATGFNACSDDHFTPRLESGTGANTIWANIEADSDLDSLRMILSRTTILKSETDKKAKGSYEDLLNSNQSVTVWAPVDGTYPAYSYLKKLDEADALATEGKTTEALKLRYEVSRQFVQNHIARYNYATSTIDKVELLNGKTSVFDRAKSTFNSVALQGELVNSSNGMLYKLNGSSPFLHNVWTYFSANPNFSKLYQALTQPKYDYNEFSRNASTPGTLNGNGNMEYVDSVYFHRNIFSQALGISQMFDEDSTLLVIAPTNNAWDKTLAKLKSLFTYSKTYKTSYQVDEAGATGHFRNTSEELNIDSLQEVNALKMLTRSMYYFPWRYGVANSADSAMVVNKALYADSLISAVGEVLFNPAADTAKPNTHLNPYLEYPKAPIKASNGYIFSLDDYAIDPAYLWVKKRTYDITHNVGLLLEVDNAPATAPQGTIESLNRENIDSTVVGEVPHNRYRRFTPSSKASLLRISIPLRDIPSANYRIKALIVPNRINKSNMTGITWDEVTPFYAQIAYDTDRNLPSIKSPQTSQPLIVDNDSVKEYVLFDNYYFEKSYANLPATVNSFARLVICVPQHLNAFGEPYNRTTSDSRTTNASLNIVKIIFEPVRN